MKSFAFVGRLQVDVAQFDGEGSGDYSALLWRRAWGGLNATVFHDLTIHGEAECNEFYLGLNYYLCGHKLKVQTGIQYADMG